MSRRKRRRSTELAAREAKGFGKYALWVPDDLPPSAVPHWPHKETWPSAAQVERFIDDTERDLDARLAVMTGLRRWAEPGSSQMMVSLGTIIIAIVAIVTGLSDIHVGFFIGVLVFGTSYIFLALFGFGQAMRVDDRRKMAHGWLKAFEDGLNARRTHTKRRIWSFHRPNFH